MDRHLHIISFNVPYPPDYGGTIDVYYKIKAFHEIGVRVILHCFDYGRGVQPALLDVCDEVYYYRRHTGICANLSLLPYNVKSRDDAQLLARLLNDDYPILFDGLHCCALINHPALKNRVKILRQHNIEHDYYRKLAKIEHGLVNKAFLTVEAWKLKRFERRLMAADLTAAVSEEETKELQSRYAESKIVFVPCFHGHSEVTTQCGMSDYVLYHGNLSVAENELAAISLVQKVFSRLDCKCVIAGKNPTERLATVVKQCDNVELRANLSADEMEQLVRNVQVNVMITQQSTGLKLKLLNSLFVGRHVLVNSLMLTGTGLDELCVVADDFDVMTDECRRLMNVPIEQSDLEKRRKLLFPAFDDRSQAERLAAMIFGTDNGD